MAEAKRHYHKRQNAGSHEGMMSAQLIFPGYSTAVPVAAQVQSVVNQHDAGILASAEFGSNDIAVWADLQMFVKAAAHPGNSPASAAVFQGVYGMKDETLAAQSTKNILAGPNRCADLVLLDAGEEPPVDASVRNCGPMPRSWNANARSTVTIGGPRSQTPCLNTCLDLV
jgi:hypothetical protein